MHYLRGETLGLFCGELGIPPSSRVRIIPFRRGYLIWDLNAGVEFHLNLHGAALVSEQKTVPAGCRALFQESDCTLLARVADPGLMPWSEERETLLSELRYRNLAYDTRPCYPLRPMFLSLLAHLGSRLNPLRLFRNPRYSTSA